jgi:hypothetical protein
LKQLSATNELFLERRHGVVDACWHIGFVAGFALTGVIEATGLGGNIAAGILGNVAGSAARAVFVYITTMCVAGLITGAIGYAVGHVIATLWERRDLRRNPRHYEAAPGDTR